MHYKTTGSESEIKCVECNKGFFVNSDNKKCEKNKITNCSKFETENKCEKCDDGFASVDNGKYCLKMNDSLNCL